MRSTKPRVVRYKWGGPNSTWQVDGLRDEGGKRMRKFFSSRDDANEWLKERRPQLRNQGRAAMGLTDAQRVDAVRALVLLEPHGVSLTAAAEAFQARAKLLSRSVTFSALRDELVKAKKSDKKSDHYVADLTSRLAVFGREFDDRQVAAIEPNEIDDWLRNLGLSQTSRFNFRKVLRTAFAFAVMRGYAAENAVLKTAKVKADPTVPGILTPKEIAALLAAADPRVAAAFALSAFAGLRDAEVGRMTWDRVDLVSGHVKVDAAIAKTSSRRLIPISDNLRAWLAPLARSEGPIRPTGRLPYTLQRYARDAALKALLAAGGPAKNLQSWPKNALRHSFVSYRLAITANPAQVAMEAGHSVQVAKQSYQELVTPAAAREWFGVMPQTAG